MKQREFEENLLGYLEGSLSPELRKEFERAAENDSRLKQLLKEYRELIALESEFASFQYHPTPSFEVKVMDRVAKVQLGVLKQLFANFKQKQRMLLPAIASFATAGLVFTLHRGYSPGAWEELSVIKLPESRQESKAENDGQSLPNTTETPTVAAIDPAPPGFSLVTIPLEQASAVEGALESGVRADVIWTYSSEGKKKSATVARFTKVVSVTESEVGEKKEPKARSATVLVTEKDAKKIQLAQSMGKVSLAGVSSADFEMGKQGAALEASGDSITINDLIGRPANEDPQEVTTYGVMYTPDPKSGRRLRYFLRRGRWELDEAFRSSESAPTESKPIQQQKLAYRVSNKGNNRVHTALQPISTFDVNLRTESYIQARKQIQMGRLPAPESVVIEEFLNYFEYDYPDQHEQLFSLTYEIARSPFDRERYLLKLAAKSKKRSELDSSVNADMSVLARDVALQVEFNPAIVAEYRLFGYDAPNLSPHQLSDAEIASSEIGFGQLVIAIYEVALVNPAQRHFEPKPLLKESVFNSAKNTLGRLKISFKTTDSLESKSMEFQLDASAVESSLSATSNDFRFAIAVAHFAQILKKSEFSSNYSLDELVKLANGARGLDIKRQRQEFIDLLTTASALLE